MAGAIARSLDGTVEFGPFRMDVRGGGLWRGEDRVHLRPKTWEILCVLVANPGRLLSKDDLLGAVWGDAAVSDTMPSISVGELRRALKDTAKSPRYVETVHGRGFRFVAELRACPDEPNDLPEASAVISVATAPAGFVGRKAKLASLASAVASDDPSCRVVLVSGDPGIGKTALIEACFGQTSDLRRSAALRDGIVGWGHCVAHYGEGYPYLPIVGVLRSMCAGRDAILSRFREIAPSWALRLPEFGGEAGSQTARSASATDSAQRALHEMVAFLRAAGAVVWVLEDLHWADEATLELLAVLAETPALEEFRVIGTMRLAEAVGRSHPVARVRRELLRRGRCREIVLDGLGESEIRDFLAVKLDSGASYPEWLAGRLLQHCNGNPFFLSHTVEHLRKAGGLANSRSSIADRDARLEAALAAVPESLRDLVEDDLGSLSGPERRVLADASLGGLDTDAATVAAASAGVVEECDTLCADLARRSQFLRKTGESLWPDGTVSGRYAFRHAIYQKVLYDDFPPAARRAAHGRIAAALVAGFGKRSSEIAPVIADHFERGGEHDNAVAYHSLAARKASERHASRDAAHHLRSALRLVPNTVSDQRTLEAEILAELGKVLPALQGFGDPALHDVYLRARSLRAKESGRNDDVDVLIGQLLANLMQRRPQPAEELAREILEIATDSGDPLSCGNAEVLMGAVDYHQGDLIGTIEHCDRALVVAPEGLRFGPIDQRCSALLMSGAALWQSGKPDAGLGRARMALQVAEAELHPFNRVIALQSLIAILQWRGEVAEALAAARSLAGDVREQGLQQAAACARLIEGWARYELGDAAALNWITDGLAVLRKDGTMMQTAYLLSVAVEVLAGLGQRESALTVLREAEAAIEDGEARWWEPELYRWRARLAASDSGANGAIAEDSLRRAIELATVQGAASLVLRASIDLAAVQRKHRRAVEARRMLAVAIESIEGGSETRDVQLGRRLFAELSQ